MLQQINLYQFLEKPKKVFFTFERLLFFYGIFIIFLALNHGIDLWQKNRLTKQLQQLKNTLQVKQQHFVNMLAEYPMMNGKDLEGSVKYLQNLLDVQTRLASISIDRVQFSQYLTSIAKASVPRAWLTQISIDNNKNLMELHGQTYHKETVEQFIEQLQRETIFAKMKIKLSELVKVEKSDTNSNESLSFLITAEKND